MLRYIFLILVPLLVVGALFYFVVLRAQPNAPKITAAQEQLIASKEVPSPGKSGVGPGSRPYIDDIENGRLASRFRADDYTPLTDGSYAVTNPESIFYMSDGQVMKVTGDNGKINCDTTATGSGPMVIGANTQPRNGWLHKVRMELYHDDRMTRPTLWMETDNLHFDNDTLRMYTESPPGSNVAADMVPVVIRGDDYEFDGNGLTVVWSGKNRRLQRLEVAHGKRLEIKNPAKISLPGMTPAPTQGKLAGADCMPGWSLQRPPVAAEAATPVGGSDLFDGLLASTDPKAFHLVVKTTPAPQPESTPYRAIFNDNVKIADTQRTLATADLMIVDFLQGSNKPKTDAAAPATVAPVVQPTAPPPPSTPAPAATPVTQPTTKPVNGPVTITWTGKLLVTPLEDQPPMMPIEPGQSVVRLVGAPVHLTPEGSTILAAQATYRSPDGAAQLISAKNATVEMHRDGGMNLTTGSIDYNPATSLAFLHGVSHLDMPVGKGTMTADWTDLGQLHMLKSTGQSQPSGVDQINLSGRVRVDHPQFSLDSNRLQLDLTPTKSTGQGNEQLKLLTANDDVKCLLKHPDHPADEGINADQLRIRTGQHNSQTVAREVIADGNVHAFDPDQSIDAGSLDAKLLPRENSAPATQSTGVDQTAAVDLESLDAKTGVHAKLKNGATADADELQVVGVGKAQKIQLTGIDQATLGDGKGGWLKGPVIDITAGTGDVAVNGPGSMRTIRAKPATQPINAEPPKPIDVTWTGRMKMDGTANTVDVYDHVLVKNTDAAGALSTIIGDTAHLDLMAAPKSTTQPATDSVAAATAGKQLKKLTMTGHIKGTSDLTAADGSVLRQGRLYCESLSYTPADGTAVIPGAGKMYVENHQDSSKDSTGSKGEMAISWQKDLVYIEAQRTITFTGDTVVGFQQDQQNKKPAKPAKNGMANEDGPMQLKSDQVVLTLAPSSTTQKSTAENQQSMKVEKMQAIGQVRFNARGVDLTADTAEYDPATTLLTAHGTTEAPVVVLAGNITGSFDVVVYDSTRQEVVSTKGSHIKASR